MASNAKNNMQTSTAIKKMAVASNNFSFELHKKLCKEPGNLFYSPLSVSTALAMLYHGARGISKAQMREVLNYDSQDLADQEIQEAFNTLLETTSQATDYILNIANSVLVHRDFSVESEYLDILKKWYQAEARNVDFVKEGEKVKDEINSWVADKTKNKIKNLIDGIDRDTVMILLNAVYFKGTWEKQFDSESTTPGTFYNNGLESSPGSVPMMMFRDEKFRYLEMKEEGFKALELPYIGDTSMWILLPNELNGIAELEKRLNTDFLNRIMEISVEKKIEVICIPKFKFEYSVGLNEHLKSMGLKNLFHEADLRGISDKSNLYVSQVIHKACIEVNEKGSEAAAATAIQICLMSLQLSRREFIVDHPFVFFVIENRSGLIMFEGKIENL